jgi:tRNA pseudouridine55 synthase
MHPKDGIIIVDKESGPSSFRVVEVIRGLTGFKKVGHAGTLDPFASGVLVVLLNQGTKLSPFIMAQDKTYRAALRLGIETDTQDATGRIIKTREIGRVEPGTIKEKSEGFVGAIKQVPPLYSAVHHKGKRAYELARNGMDVELKEREVRVQYIKILSVDLPTVWIEVRCSSGTYIRTIVGDLGTSLGTGAHVTFLRRLQSGPFHVNNACTVTQLAHYGSARRLDESIIPLREALKGMGEVEVSDVVARKIRSGQKPQRSEIGDHGPSSSHTGASLKAVMRDELVAILEEARDGYKIVRVFT